MTPAKAIAAALHAQGITKQGKQADVLEVSQQLWSLWVRGDKRMREDSIQRCLFNAHRAGYVVRLEWRADGCYSDEGPEAKAKTLRGQDNQP